MCRPRGWKTRRKAGNLADQWHAAAHTLIAMFTRLLLHVGVHGRVLSAVLCA